MGQAQRFEDLIAWQKARVVVQHVYRLTRGRVMREDRSLADQIRRAAVSSMSNIAEGYERRAPAEYAHMLKVAIGSAGEVRSQTYVVEDCGYAEPSECRQVRELAEEVSRITSGLRDSVLAREM